MTEIDTVTCEKCRILIPADALQCPQCWGLLRPETPIDEDCITISADIFDADGND